jgi:hypothetical protein
VCESATNRKRVGHKQFERRGEERMREREKHSAEEDKK